MAAADELFQNFDWIATWVDAGLRPAGLLLPEVPEVDDHKEITFSATPSGVRAIVVVRGDVGPDKRQDLRGSTFAVALKRAADAVSVPADAAETLVRPSMVEAIEDLVEEWGAELSLKRTRYQRSTTAQLYLLDLSTSPKSSMLVSAKGKTSASAIKQVLAAAKKEARHSWRGDLVELKEALTV